MNHPEHEVLRSKLWAVFTELSLVDKLVATIEKRSADSIQSRIA